MQESDTLILPPHLYPAFAPLPAPVVQHLVLQEYRQNRRMAPASIWKTVLQRVERARKKIYRYMHLFVLEAETSVRKGRGLSFPDEAWVRDEVLHNAPPEIQSSAIRVSERAIADWLRRGILLREREYGPFDLDSVAALLIARVVDEDHERGWLPSQIEEQEPRWWCYCQRSPSDAIVPLAYPFADEVSAPSLVWTPWMGAAWKKTWQAGQTVAYRWTGRDFLDEDVTAWDQSMATELFEILRHVSFGKEAVHLTLLQEARKIILQRQIPQIEARRKERWDE